MKRFNAGLIEPLDYFERLFLLLMKREMVTEKFSHGFIANGSMYYRKAMYVNT